MTSVRHARLLGACAVGAGLAAACWFAFTGPYPLDAMCDRRRAVYVFGFGERPRYPAMTAVEFTGALAALNALYLLGLGLAARLRGRTAAVTLVGIVPVALVGALFAGFPLLSNDVYQYLFSGRILAVHGENPFVREPKDFPGDRFYDLIFWKEDVNAYGPLWRALEAASALIGGDGCATAVIAMKLWPILAYLGTCAALYLILRTARPGGAVAGTLLYAWSPLVILEAVQNGHNDVVAALPCVLAVWLASTGRFRAAFPLLAIGTLVKPLAPLLGPLLLVEAVRRGRAPSRDALVGIVLAGDLMVVAWAPFWRGLETLQGLERETMFDASPAALLLHGLQSLGWSSDDAMTLTRNVVRGLFLALYAAISLALWSGRLSLPAAALGAFLAYLLVAAQWFNPWYLLWLIPFAALVPDRSLRVVAVTFALLAPLTYPFKHDARILVPVVFLPVALLAAGAALDAWRRHSGYPMTWPRRPIAGARDIAQDPR